MQVDIVNTFERKMNPKCLPKHRKVSFLVGILELQGRCSSQEGATEGKQGNGRNPRTALAEAFCQQSSHFGSENESKMTSKMTQFWRPGQM